MLPVVLPRIITQKGEAKVVMQGAKSYEETQETMAFLNILALGTQQIKDGHVHSFTEVKKNIQEQHRTS